MDLRQKPRRKQQSSFPPVAWRGHEFDIQAMFDRVYHPARGRRGGQAGAATPTLHDDDTAMNGKGKQFVPDGRRVMMAFPGGAGYGNPSDRPRELVKRILARGYISAETAANDYGLTADDIAEIEAGASRMTPCRSIPQTQCVACR